MQSNDSGWQTMHSALGDAYMVLCKSLMEDFKIPRNELERVIAGLETALSVKERNCDIGNLLENVVNGRRRESTWRHEGRERN